MKAKRIGLGVAVLAALTVATGSTSVAQPHDDGFGGKDPNAGHDIIVKGNHNQIVLGDDNHVDRGGMSRDTENENENGEDKGEGNRDDKGEDKGEGNREDKGEGKGEKAKAPAPPYATVNKLVSTFLAEREGPTTESPEVARFSRGDKVPVACFVPDGEPVDGNSTWYLVRDEPGLATGFISSHFADLKGEVPLC